MEDFVINPEANGGEQVTIGFKPDVAQLKLSAICYGNHWMEIGFSLNPETAKELAVKLIEYAAACDKNQQDAEQQVEPQIVRRRPRKGYGAL